MKTFKYSIIPKILYRYSVIPANLILLFYFLVSCLGIITNWKFIFPLSINIILIYVLNRFYFKMYKSFPFKIDVNNEEMICSDFVFKNRILKIKHSDIVKISGGIFSGRAYMPLYVNTQEEKIGISPHIKDYNKLLTIMLTNIPKELYESLLQSIQKIAIDNTPKRNKK